MTRLPRPLVEGRRSDGSPNCSHAWARTVDGIQGGTWTQAHLLDLPNPNSGIDAVGLRDGRVVLIYNDTIKGRTPLNLAISSDGEHFKMFYTLEDEPGEYSYPAIIQGKNGDLLMTWTWDRKRIRFAHLPTPSAH